jgi:hypothetical protein
LLLLLYIDNNSDIYGERCCILGGVHGAVESLFRRYTRNGMRLVVCIYIGCRVEAKRAGEGKNREKKREKSELID